MRTTLLLWLIYGLFGLGVVRIAALLGRSFPLRWLAIFSAVPVLFLLPGFVHDVSPVPADHAQTFVPWAPEKGSGPVYNPSLNDVVTQFVPWNKAVRMSWKAGSLPFLNRWNGCGSALSANGTSAAFSPLTILLFLLPLFRGYVLLGACKLFLALTGMYLWMREIGVSELASCISALSFALSFAITPWLYHPASGVIALWPWALWLVTLLGTVRLSVSAFVTLALLIAVWPTMGHLESVALGALVCVAWAISGTGIPLRVRGRRVGHVLLCGLVGIALSAFVLLPQLIAIRSSNRLVLATSPSHFNFVPWVPYRPGWLGGLVTTILPRSFGDGIDSPMISGAAGSLTEMGFGHFGLVGVCLALLWLRPGSRRHPASVFGAALVVVGLGGALGLPLFRQAVDLIPGIHLAPPLRLLTLVSLGGCLLAGVEFDRLSADLRSSRAGLLLSGAATALGLLALAVYFALSPSHRAAGGSRSQESALIWALCDLLGIAGVGLVMAVTSRKALRFPDATTVAGYLLLALAALDLGHQGTRLYRFYDIGGLFVETPLTRFLATRPGPFRVVGDGAALFPNTNVFAGVEEVRTHDPLERRDYVEFLDATCGYEPFAYFKTIANLNSPALAFLNVGYLVSTAGREKPGPHWIPEYSGSDGTVFRNDLVLPRVFAPSRIERAPTLVDPRQNALRAFGPALLAVLKQPEQLREKALILDLPEVRERTGEESRNPDVQIRNLAIDGNRASFRAQVSGARSSFVVGSFVQDGGWSATLDGAPKTVRLADGPFIALQIPPGAHDVELRYEPPGFRIGSYTSLGMLLGLVVAIIVRRVRKAGKAAPDRARAAKAFCPR